MKLRELITIWLCKFVYWVLRRTGRHGAALPGLIAEKINPNLLNKLKNLPDGIIVVSGTNGKTTTTHLTSEVLRRMGKRVFTNHSGSNMTRGLLASIIRFSSLSGKLPYDVAVLEIDEAYAAKLAPVLSPRACILTNVLRDQLDRFGEIDYTAELLKTLSLNTTDLVVFNICDPRLKNLPHNDLARYVSYGYDNGIATNFPNDDDWHASTKQTIEPSSDYTLMAFSDTQLEVSHIGSSQKIKSLQLPGSHNALNLTAVIALIGEMYPNLEADFTNLRPPYGRGEVVVLHDKRFTLQLVKNPAGFATAMSADSTQPALIVINDAIADSRDVSWLWDVDVSALAKRPALYTSGTRAYDMANRLKYADIKVKSSDVDIERSLDDFIDANSGGVIFLTYTAMLRVRKLLHHIQKGEK
jgi:UDP-N-acetylmuramyl tripeptide synthase